LAQLVTRTKLIEEPGASERPVAVDGAAADPERAGGLEEGKSGEDAQLDHLGSLGVDASESREGVVEVDQVFGRGVVVEQFGQFYVLAPAVAPALEPLLVPSSVQENSAHGLRRSGIKVAAAVPRSLRAAADQS